MHSNTVRLSSTRGAKVRIAVHDKESIFQKKVSLILLCSKQVKNKFALDILQSLKWYLTLKSQLNGCHFQAKFRENRPDQFQEHFRKV